MKFLSKTCLICEKLFHKSSTVSLNTWENKTKYCSRSCSALSVRDKTIERNISNRREGVAFDYEANKHLSQKDYHKAFYRANKKKYQESSRKKYQENKAEILARRRELMKNETPEHREKRLDYLRVYNAQPERRAKQRKLNQSDKGKYRSYIDKSAKSRGYDFTLTFEQFVKIFHGDCYLCGVAESRGIDRIDNPVGYILDNCRPCCITCNKMKSVYSEEVFLKHIEKIHRHKIML